MPAADQPTAGGQDQAADAENDKPAPASESLDVASDRIRQTAKWLVATFGAVAGALIVGLQLSDIGKLEGTDRVLASIAAFGALLAVIMIITLATLVLARGRVPLGELSIDGSWRYKRLRRALNRNRVLYAGFESISALVATVEDLWQKQYESWSCMTSPDASQAQRTQAEKNYAAVTPTLMEMNKLTKRLLATARAEDVRLTFEWVRVAITALAIMVAVGGIAFAFIDNAPGEDETAALAQRPVAARLHLDQAGREKLRPILGSECRLTKVPVEVLSTSDEAVSEAVVIPAEGCASARVKIEPDEGEFQAVGNAGLPVPTVSGADGLNPPPPG